MERSMAALFLMLWLTAGVRSYRAIGKRHRFPPPHGFVNCAAVAFIILEGPVMDVIDRRSQ